MFSPGDRIELEFMGDGPGPVPAGTRGTVVGCTEHPPGSKNWTVDVDWDNGRTLGLCVPPDRARRV